MLISSHRYKVSEGFLHFPEWILAPLSLNEHQSAFVVINQYSPSPTNEPDIPEIVISGFPADTWTDLWRIQLQFVPGMGRALDLNEFLLKRDLEILAYEVYEGSHGDDGNIFNSFHLIVSARQYRSPNDDDSKTRSSKPFARLWDLEDDIGVHFVDKLNFQNRKIPRLHVRRLAQHRILGLAPGLSIQNIRIERRGTTRRTKIGFDTSKIAAALRNTTVGANFRRKMTGKEGAYITPTVDAYERFIRVLPLDAHCPIHFAHFICAKDDALSVRILRALRRKNANIIKMQIRTGIGRWEQRVFNAVRVGKPGTFVPVEDIERRSLMRLSVTFSVDREQFEYKPADYIRELLFDLSADLELTAGPPLPLPHSSLSKALAAPPPAVEATFVILADRILLLWDPLNER